MNNKIGMIVIGLIVIVFFGISTFRSNKNLGGIEGSGLRFTSATNTFKSLGAPGATSTLVDTADSSRAYRYFCNTDAVAPVYLALGVQATTTSGIYIAPKSCYEMNQQNDFIGNVYGITASSGTTTLTVITNP